MSGDFFLRNPRMAALAIAFITITAIGATFSLPRLEDPVLERRFGSVTTFLPGADAERVEALVTGKIEERLLEMPELDELISRSRANVSAIQISLEETVPDDQIASVWAEIRQKVDQAEADLPPEASEPDVEWFQTPAATLIAAVHWTSDEPVSYGLLSRLARDLEDRIRNLPDVADTVVLGEAEEEIRVVFDIEALTAVGLTFDQAAARLAAGDPKSPAGNLHTQGSDILVDVSGEFQSLDRIRRIPLLETGDGRFLEVGDLARVERSVTDPLNATALVNGRPGVMVSTIVAEGVRVDQWTERVRGEIDRFGENVTGNVAVATIFEQNTYTERRLSALVVNFLAAVGIVFAVLVLTMGLASAMVVGLSLPLTVAATIAGFMILGVPFHQMSITGLIIALGLMIDNPIVVTDEYARERAQGLNPGQAASRAVARLWKPLLASTITTLLAFAPIAFMPGVAGEFIGTMGLAVILAVGASYCVSMSLAPAFAGWALGAGRDNGKKRHIPFVHEGWTPRRLNRLYRQSVTLAVRRPVLGIAVSIALPLIGFLGAGALPMQFFPPTDRDQFFVRLTMPIAASFEETQTAVKAIDALVRSEDGVKDTHWVIADQAPKTYYNVQTTGEGVTNQAAGFVNTASAEATRALLPRLQTMLMERFPQAQIRAYPFEQGPPFDAPIEVQLQGPDIAVLRKIGRELQAILAQTPKVTYAVPQVQGGRPTLRLEMDEEAGRLAGLQLTDVVAQLGGGLEGGVGGSILEGVEEVPVRVIANTAARSDLAELAGMPLVTGGARPSDGRLGVPLDAVATPTLVPETGEIVRIDGLRVNPIYGFLEPFALPAPALAAFKERLEKADIDLPPGYSLSFAGEDEARGNAIGNLLSFAVPLLILMLSAVVVTFNSFRYAGMIFLVAFLSVGLALFGVRSFGWPLGFTAIVGTLGLVGLAINGAIVVLSLLRENEAARRGDRAAIVDTTLGATRHILSTTLTTVGGFLPLIVFGGTFWPPLATAIAGGVSGAAILALYLTPALFTLSVRGKAAKAAAPDRPAGKPAPA